jgi:hydrogenase expression/formation protein HypC
MCLGFPGKIIEMDEFNALVDIGGTKKNVSLMILPDKVDVGDFVMVHVGFAVAKMDPNEAEKTLKTIMELANDIDEEF